MLSLPHPARSTVYVYADDNTTSGAQLTLHNDGRVALNATYLAGGGVLVAIAANAPGVQVRKQEGGAVGLQEVARAARALSL
jgi:hypothetical protein